MELYTYKAIDKNFNTITGEIDANSEEESIRLLRERGLSPINVKMSSKSASYMKNMLKSDLFPQKVKLMDLATLCKQLAIMLRAGMALDRAMTTQIEQTDNPTLKKALQEIEKKIKQGTGLSKAMSDYPDVFPKILTHMLEAGEMTGNMDNSMENMSDYFEKEHGVRKKIKGALIYPMVLFILTIVVTLALLIFVIPMFSEIFESSGGSLPFMTKILVDFSSFLLSYWYLFLAGTIAIVIIIKRWLGSKAGRYQFDGWKLSLPIIKKPMMQIVTARFTSTLSTMLSGGITITFAVESAADTVNNVVVESKLHKVAEELKEGRSLSELLNGTEIFPEMMLSMVGIGEQTGDLDHMMENTASYYNREFDSAIQTMVAFIEPITIIFMGLMVGMIVIALYLPIFDMVNHVG